MPELDLTLAWNFATALLIGALIGIERERHKQRLEHPEIAGLRTFMLLALFGGAERLGQPGARHRRGSSRPASSRPRPQCSPATC